MSVREIFGLILLIIGVVTAPLGWIVSHKILLISGALLFVGMWLFYTARVARREQELSREGSSGGSHGPSVPGDVHNYTGWRSGGRTEPFESTSSGNGGGGDGGGD